MTRTACLLVLAALLLTAAGSQVLAGLGRSDSGHPEPALCDCYDVTVGPNQVPGDPQALARLAAEKMAALQGRIAALGIRTIPDFKTLPVTTIEQGLVHDYDSRSCVHCGAACVLMLLRYLNADGDLSATDGEAIHQLGDGWLNGDNSSYAILLHGNTGWYNDAPRMALNLNARQGGNTYDGTYGNMAGVSLQQFKLRVVTQIVAGFPLIPRLKTNYLVRYKNIRLGHFVVAQGYSYMGDSIKLNDPNDCSSKSGDVSGTYWEAAEDVYKGITDADYGASAVMVW